MVGVIGMLSEVTIEFIIVMGSLLAMILFFILAGILLIGNNRLWRRSEAAFNAGIVCLVFAIGFIVVEMLMWMFYPSYFGNVLRTMFGL